MLFNEIDMLETRLHILEDVVDHFVIVEAAETHSGKPKPYYLQENLARFERWRDKMLYIQVDDLTGAGRGAWERERYQRSRIADGLFDAAPDDWIIVCDCDEIPDPTRVGMLRHLPISIDAAKFELQFYYYDVNHRVDQGWAVGATRWSLEKDPNRIRVCANQPQIVWHGGWHFSWFGGAQAIVEKVDAFMHAGDVARHMPRDTTYVEDKVNAGLDLFNRVSVNIVRVPLSNTLPRYILDNRAKYEALGWLKS
jgi:beta-1,4-mannosyl-glycoprotein beta-1,4-N-acetylglucosaminyltransferase